MTLSLDLLYLSVVLSIIGMIVLGIVIFFSNPKSFTSKSFLFLSIAAALWSFFNYLYNLPNLGNLALLFLRIHLVAAIWYTFFTCLFLANFPEERVKLSLKHIIVLILLILISGLNLSKFTFENITKFDNEGRVLEVKTNFGIIIFTISVVSLLIYGFYKFIKNFNQRKNKTTGDILVFAGIILTFIFHIIFNIVFPNVFKNPKYTQLGALFTFPFVISTFYAIIKYKFLRIKIILTDTLVIILLILIAIQTLSKGTLIEKFIGFIIFISVLIIGSILMTTLRKEIEQKEQLEQLNRIKSEFLSFASHQVKALMAIAKGYAELIAKNIDNVPEQAKDFAKKIKESIDNLLVLVEEFMDYRRIEEGKLEYNFENVEIVNFIKEIFDKFTFSAKEKGLEYIFESKITKAEAKIDKTRFGQVIQNLIDNALKYTKQGFVKLNIWQEDNRLIICVSDSGIGMSKELQSKLFGKFVRDPSIKKEIKGTGLGLYIAKNIVEDHQGKIWAESEGEGKGSKFYVAIPLLE